MTPEADLDTPGTGSTGTEDAPEQYKLVVHLECLMERDGIRMKDLADRLGVHRTNLSKLKSGQVGAIYFKTLGRLCVLFACQPGDLLSIHPVPIGDDPFATHCPVHHHRWRGGSGEVDADDV